jgi:flagellar motility protein MotE (MotC chaperone)
VAEKKISDEVKISDAALQWTVNLASRLEQANIMIDKKQQENDRLHDIIDVMKRDFEREFQKLKDDFNDRIRELENEFKKSKNDLIKEREDNREEIKRLKLQINGKL